MFEMVRPLVPVNGPSQIYPPVDYRPVERPVVSIHFLVTLLKILQINIFVFSSF